MSEAFHYLGGFKEKLLLFSFSHHRLYRLCQHLPLGKMRYHGPLTLLTQVRHTDQLPCGTNDLKIKNNKTNIFINT